MKKYFNWKFILGAIAVLIASFILIVLIQEEFCAVYFLLIDLGTEIAQPNELCSILYSKWVFLYWPILPLVIYTLIYRSIVNYKKRLEH